MNKFLFLLNVIQFAIILVLTNPSEQTHREEAIVKMKTEVTADTGLIDKLKNVADAAKSLAAAYNNYYVCSTLAKDGKTVTFGILGKVYWLGAAASAPAQ